MRFYFLYYFITQVNIDLFISNICFDIFFMFFIQIRLIVVIYSIHYIYEYKIEKILRLPKIYVLIDLNQTLLLAE